VDFSNKQRAKLQRCYQNGLQVQDYVYKLNELWTMIGDMDERTCVHKFWFGLQKAIQQSGTKS